MEQKKKILIVDDEKMTRDAMARILGADYDCLTAADPELALAELERNPDTALLLTDYKMPVMNGVELIQAARKKFPSLNSIVITAFAEVQLAVEAMKLGADDFVTKPVTDFDDLRKRIARAIKIGSLQRKADADEPVREASSGLAAFTGTSPAMERVYHLIRKVAPTEATVLIGGPSGTGKELTARAIHDLSRRAAGPFVAVECASLPATLLETELFGSVKGAYTDARDRKGCFETANGGTLFLDEIGDIDLAAQVKLLRVLETRVFQRVGETIDRPADFRLIAASNQDFAKLIAEGKFREDLFYRLNVIDIHLPALKDRPGDIPELVGRFLKEFSAANGNAVKGIEPAALQILQNYSWPGNVRQLRNAIEKMVVLAGGPMLTAGDVPPEFSALPFAVHTPAEPPAASPEPPAASPEPPAAGPATLEDNEKRQILAALEANGGNKSKAADQLGISRRTIHRKLKEWGMS